MKTKKAVIGTKLGLHARPANILMQNAQKYKSKVEISINDKTYNAKSIIGILGAGVNYNDEIEIICNGLDEEEACENLAVLVETGLDD